MSHGTTMEPSIKPGDTLLPRVAATRATSPGVSATYLRNLRRMNAVDMGTNISFSQFLSYLEAVKAGQEELKLQVYSDCENEGDDKGSKDRGQGKSVKHQNSIGSFYSDDDSWVPGCLKIPPRLKAKLQQQKEELEKARKREEKLAQEKEKERRKVGVQYRPNNIPRIKIKVVGPKSEVNDNSAVSNTTLPVIPKPIVSKSAQIIRNLPQIKHRQRSKTTDPIPDPSDVQDNNDVLKAGLRVKKQQPSTRNRNAPTNLQTYNNLLPFRSEPTNSKVGTNVGLLKTYMRHRKIPQIARPIPGNGLHKPAELQEAVVGGGAGGGVGVGGVGGVDSSINSKQNFTTDPSSQTSTSQVTDSQLAAQDKRLRRPAPRGHYSKFGGAGGGNYKRWYFTQAPCPVRVYLSYQGEGRGEKHIEGIYDAWGRTCLPVSKQGILKGMVYNKEGCSLHPPLPVAARTSRPGGGGGGGGRKAMAVARRESLKQSLRQTSSQRSHRLLKQRASTVCNAMKLSRHATSRPSIS